MELNKLEEQFIGMLPVLLNGEGISNHGLITDPTDGSLQVAALDVENTKEATVAFLQLCSKVESLQFICGLTRDWKGRKVHTIFSYDDNRPEGHEWKTGELLLTPGMTEFNVQWTEESILSKIVQTEISLALHLLKRIEENKEKEEEITG